MEIIFSKLNQQRLQYTNFTSFNYTSIKAKNSPLSKKSPFEMKRDTIAIYRFSVRLSSDMHQKQ